MYDSAGWQPTTDRDDPLGSTIVELAAEVTDTDPLDLPILYEAADIPALERLYQESGRQLFTSFEYAGCAIWINGSGVVAVAEADD